MAEVFDYPNEYFDDRVIELVYFKHPVSGIDCPLYSPVLTSLSDIVREFEAVQKVLEGNRNTSWFMQAGDHHIKWLESFITTMNSLMIVLLTLFISRMQ